MFSTKSSAINDLIKESLNSFFNLIKTQRYSVTNPKDIFRDFVSYFYTAFEEKIQNEKKESIKNKYIKIQKNCIRYIIANERAITTDIRNRKINK